MSGRRLKITMQQALQNAVIFSFHSFSYLVFFLFEKGVWTNDSVVVIAGLSNSYTHYITTYEEYQEQRYEGASTLYGPHTLAAYQQNFYDIITKLVTNQTVPSGPQPYDMRGKTFSFVVPPVWDGNNYIYCCFA